MKVRQIYTLITVAALFCFVNADAQTTQKKPVKKPVKKAVIKPVAKPAKPAAKPVSAKTAADVKKVTNIAKTLTDTTRKGGAGNTPPVPSNSLSEEIIVTTAYKPLLADAVKIRRSPDLENTEPFKAPLTYSPLDKSLEQNTDIRELPAMSIPKEKDADVNNRYAKFAVGSYKTTYGELYINNDIDQALQVGGYLKHLMQNSGAGDAGGKQAFQKEEAGIFGKSIGEQSNISGSVNYEYRSNYFYGYGVNPLPATPAAIPAPFVNDKQHFSTLSGEAEIAKNYQDQDEQLLYSLKLSGYTFSNAYQAKENNITLAGYLNQTVDQFYAGVSGSVDFNSVKDSLYSFNNNIVRANPYLKFQGTNYKIDAGVNIVGEFGNASRFSIFPAAKLEFQVIPKYVRLFAEVKGDVNKASIHDYSETNPFLAQNINILNSVDKLDLSVGLKGMLAPGFGFKATFFRNSVKNLPMFVSAFNSAKSYNQFSVIYDGGNARVNGFNGELDYKPSDNLDIFGRVELKDYTLATETQPWNLPKFLLTAGTAIHINDKVNITGSMIFRGATTDRFMNATTTSIINVNSFLDLSGGVEYKINTRLSIFGQVNNMLSNQYQMWSYYPNYGFNIFGGVGYKF